MKCQESLAQIMPLIFITKKDYILIFKQSFLSVYTAKIHSEQNV